jgi:hypothetical protein
MSARGALPARLSLAHTSNLCSEPRLALNSQQNCSAALWTARWPETLGANEDDHDTLQNRNLEIAWLRNLWETNFKRDAPVDLLRTSALLWRIATPKREGIGATRQQAQGWPVIM